MTNEDVNHPSLRPDDQVMAELLEDARPAPPARFRGALARQLTDQDPGWGSRPAHLWLHALSLIVVGALLLVVGALISAGGI
jgi:hypothetical protein